MSTHLSSTRSSTSVAFSKLQPRAICQRNPVWRGLQRELTGSPARDADHGRLTRAVWSHQTQRRMPPPPPPPASSPRLLFERAPLVAMQPVSDRRLIPSQCQTHRSTRSRRRCPRVSLSGQGNTAPSSASLRPRMQPLRPPPGTGKDVARSCLCAHLLACLRAAAVAAAQASHPPPSQHFPYKIHHFQCKKPVFSVEYPSFQAQRSP